MLIGSTSTIAMYWIGPGDWQLALLLFIIGNIGVAASIVFYESLLPHLVSAAELDRVSSAGYAVGYLGGGVLPRGVLVGFGGPVRRTDGAPGADRREPMGARVRATATAKPSTSSACACRSWAWGRWCGP